jgi:DNA repair protein RadC
LTTPILFPPVEPYYECSSESRFFNEGLGVPAYTTKLVSLLHIPYDQRIVIQSKEDVVALLRQYYDQHDREEVVTVLLDPSLTVTGLVQISIGALDQTMIDPRAVFKAALLGNAAGFILAHNHPSGNPRPSKADLAITKELCSVGEGLRLPVVDHIILTPDTYTSFSGEGLIDFT